MPGLVLLALAILFAGCGGSGDGGGSPTEPEPTTDLTVAVSPQSISTTGVARVDLVVSGPERANRVVRLATDLGALDHLSLSTDGAGRAGTRLRGTGTSGVARLSATLEGTGPTRTIEVRIGLDRSLELTVAPSSIAGDTTARIRVLLFEPDGTPPPRGTPVNLTTSLGRLDDTRPTTDPSGAASTVLSADGDLGTAHITATAPGVAQAAAAEVEILPGRSLTLGVQPPAFSSDSNGTVVARVSRLAPGVSIAGVPVTLRTDLGRLATGQVTTDSNGLATTTLFADGATGTAHLEATAPGSRSASAEAVFGGEVTLGLTANPTRVATDGSSSLTALASEPNGSPLTGASVSFTTTLGKLSTDRRTTDTSGLASVTLRGEGTTGTATVSARLLGTDRSATVEVEFAD